MTLYANIPTMISVNSYFDGKVQSLGFQAESGKATVGVMLPGEYVFGTSSKEEMRIVSGTLEVKLPEEPTFKAYNPGDVFFVEPNVKFTVKLNGPVSYLCLYN